MSANLYTIGNETGVKSLNFVKNFKNSYLAKRFAKRNYYNNYIIIENDLVTRSNKSWLQGKNITGDAIKALNYLASIFSVSAENIKQCVNAYNIILLCDVAKELAGKRLSLFVNVSKGLEKVYNEYAFNKGLNCGIWGFKGEITNAFVKGVVNDPAKGLITVNHKVYTINGNSYTCEALNGAITK